MGEKGNFPPSVLCNLYNLGSGTKGAISRLIN